MIVTVQTKIANDEGRLYCYLICLQSWQTSPRITQTPKPQFGKESPIRKPVICVYISENYIISHRMWYNIKYVTKSEAKKNASFMKVLTFLKTSSLLNFFFCPLKRIFYWRFLSSWCQFHLYFTRSFFCNYIFGGEECVGKNVDEIDTRVQFHQRSTSSFCATRIAFAQVDLHWSYWHIV